MDNDKVLEILKSQGKITDDDITRATHLANEGFEEVVFILHTLLCTDVRCTWEDEETLDNPWKMKHHQQWYNRVMTAVGPIDPAQIGNLKMTIQNYANMIEVLKDANKQERGLWRLIYQHGYQAPLMEPSAPK